MRCKFENRIFTSQSFGGTDRIDSGWKIGVPKFNIQVFLNLNFEAPFCVAELKFNIRETL